MMKYKLLAFFSGRNGVDDLGKPSCGVLDRHDTQLTAGDHFFVWCGAGAALLCIHPGIFTQS